MAGQRERADERDKILILNTIKGCTEPAALVAAALHSVSGYQSALKASAKRDNGLKRGKCDSDTDIRSGEAL